MLLYLNLRIVNNVIVDVVIVDYVSNNFALYTNQRIKIRLTSLLVDSLPSFELSWPGL